MTSPVGIELIYDRDCPNVESARRMIRAALADAGKPTRWVEWDRADPATPDDRRGFGSPTVLVDGRDVAGDENGAGRSDASSCRVYRDECGCVCGAPPAALIAEALRRARGRSAALAPVSQRL